MNISIRFAEESDTQYLVNWLLQPGVLDWFPLEGLKEIEDAAKIWLSYRQYEAVLTILVDGLPVGIANLYLQPYKKLSHQCLFAIIIDEKMRGKGIGTRLMQELMQLAKERFNITLLHLEVYEGNPAILLYEKLGFVVYGKQRHFVKETTGYKTKILMQKLL